MEETPGGDDVSYKDYIHYKKINIFGDSDVGKSSLIELMQNYDKKDFQIKNKCLLSRDSFTESNSIIEQIEKIDIPINEENHLYVNVYETNLSKYNTIKMNLDTLLFQTECIIIMWDNSEADSFKDIKDLISVIVSGIKEKVYNNVPIFLVRNKMDLELARTSSFTENIKQTLDDSIKEIKNIYKDYITYKEISLLNKDIFYDLILEINRQISYYIDNKLGDEIVKNVKLHKKPIDNKAIENNKKINCILLGDSSVGKTSFINKIKGNEDNNMSTIGFEHISISAEVYKEKVDVKLTDTAGQERFRSIAANYFRDAEAILLMFDVTNIESFEAIETWISSIKENSLIYKIILIGNKIDLNDKRIVNKKDVQRKAEKYNIKYYECCCLNGLNIYEILNELIFLGYICHNEKQNNPQLIKKSKTFHLKKQNKKNAINNNQNDEFEIIDNYNFSYNNDSKDNKYKRSCCHN